MNCQYNYTNQLTRQFFEQFTALHDRIMKSDSECYLVLAELVELKNIKQAGAETMNAMGYESRKNLAWAKAFRIVESRI